MKKYSLYRKTEFAGDWSQEIKYLFGIEFLDLSSLARPAIIVYKNFQGNIYDEESQEKIFNISF